MSARRNHILESMARAPTLALLLDLDGTLIPFASEPSLAVLDDEAREIVAALSGAPGALVAIVSGRPHAELAPLFAGLPGVRLAAEHGVWRREGGEWTSLALDGADVEPVERAFRGIARDHDGALVERKLWSATLHRRRVPPSDREALLVEALDAVAPWLAEHPEYELLEGELVLEVRHRGANKGRAVEWLRSAIPPGTPFVALGDDRTDEDMFAALSPRDVSIRIGRADQPSRAVVRLDDVTACRAFLRALLDARTAADHRAVIARLPAAQATPSVTPADLVVISNRLPDAPMSGASESDRARNVGGLVSGLGPALATRRGIWLGWSGGKRDDAPELAVDVDARPARAAFDFRPEWHDRFYNGFANRSLWPMFHGFPGRARFDDAEWDSYIEVNEVFARHAAKIAKRDAAIWVHDYQLLLVAAALRRLGHRGRIGLFVHIPFPAVDVFETIPWAREIIEGMLAYDVVGFHTSRYADNFVSCAAEQCPDAARAPRGLRSRGREVRVGVFPLGIDIEAFSASTSEPVSEEALELQAVLRGRKLVLGVDRLDYSKGIVERLSAFGRMLELFPEWRGRVSMLQVAVPSRADVPEYAAQRKEIESLVGRINGMHGEAHWVPIRYVYRSYGRSELAALYRASDVGFITPLRDGMNLVAKEFVAAQNDANPGALVLSKFAGAADELRDAILTNPHHRDGMARDLARALVMPIGERQRRHAGLIERLRSNAPDAWAGAFLRELEAVS